MLNLFIASTTYGQTFSCIFDLRAEGTIAQKRITPAEECVAIEPVFEKALSQEKIAEYISSGDVKKISGLGKAKETEDIRVNSLYAFYLQLDKISKMKKEKGVILAYIPQQLLYEIEGGKYKFTLLGEDNNPYYSEEELEIWKKIMPLLTKLYPRLVFKNIISCKTNKSGTEEQALRVTIYKSMYAVLLDAYKKAKAERKGAVDNPKLDSKDDEDSPF